jgi:uncharacterized NAD-dependent epimerase/dehydratase family protein
MNDINALRQQVEEDKQMVTEAERRAAIALEALEAGHEVVNILRSQWRDAENAAELLRRRQRENQASLDTGIF